MMTDGNFEIFPTIFHITHHKAGSQWVREILKFACPEHFIPQEYRMAQITQKQIIAGQIYAACYLDFSKFSSHVYPTHWDILSHPNKTFLQGNYDNFVQRKMPVKVFFVIRDLRDTLVSLYFSRKISHEVMNQEQKKIRMLLLNLSMEDGLLYMIRHSLSTQAKIQKSWQGGNVKTFRYEDLVSDPYKNFHQIIDFCAISISSEHLDAIIEANLFTNVTGRKPGEENQQQHLRKGIVGDWRNYFTDKVKHSFKQNFGDLLIMTGYEQNSDW